MFAAVSSVAGRTTTEVIEQAKIVPVCRTLQRRIGENHGVGEEGQLDVKYGTRAIGSSGGRGTSHVARGIAERPNALITATPLY